MAGRAGCSHCPTSAREQTGSETDLVTMGLIAFPASSVNANMGGSVAFPMTDPRAKQLLSLPNFKIHIDSLSLSLALIPLKTEQRIFAGEERFLVEHGGLNPCIYLCSLPKPTKMTVNKYNIQIYNDNEMGEGKIADEQYEHFSERGWKSGHGVGE